MYREIFTELGLSKNEAKIYEVLLSTGDTTAATISRKTSIHRRNTYDTLERLTKKGLVSPIFTKGEHLYQAVNPDKLMTMLKEKVEKLHTILPELQKAYHAKEREEATYIYKGKEGLKNYVRELLASEGDGYSLGAKGLLHTISPTLSTELWTQLKKQKRNFYTLYDPRIPKMIPEVLKDEGGKQKILPKEYESSGVVDIFGDYVVTFANVGVGQITEDTTIFVMVNEHLADSYRTWFRYLWDVTPDIKI